MSLKISELTASSGLTADDLFPVVNDPSGTPQTLKATVQQVLDYVTGSTFDNLTVTSLTASISGATAQFTTLTANVVSASTYLGVIGGTGTPGGDDQTIQFNSGSTFSGSTNLVYNYLTDTLSGTTAQFTTLTASNVTVTDSMLVYGTASLDTNPDAAYVRYESSIDKLIVFPGLYVSGALTSSGEISGTTGYFTSITASVVSASSYVGLPAGNEQFDKLIVTSSAVSLSPNQRVIFASNVVEASISITLPSISSADPREYYVIKSDNFTGSVFVSGNLTDTINGQNVYELNGPYQSITIINDSNGNWYVF